MDEGLVGTKVGQQALRAVPPSPLWGHLPQHQGTCESPWCCTQHRVRVTGQEKGGRQWPELVACTHSPSPSLLPSQILSRYDVVLVQEVRDSDLSAVTDLMEQLNRYKRGWG